MSDPNKPEENMSEPSQADKEKTAGEAAESNVETEAKPVEGELVEEALDADGDLASKVLELEEKLVTASEDVLRAKAEVQNIQRRADQDVEKARKFAVEKLVSDLLPVMDSLETTIATIESDDSNPKAILEGVNITLKSLNDTLTKYGVQQVDPHGEPFDPNLHEAMTMIENLDSEHNTVLDVFRKGYLLNGRLVRPAMVVVNRHKNS